MRRIWTTAAVLAGVQAALVAVYLLSEDKKSARAIVFERLERESPDLVYRTSGGTERRLSDHLGRPVLVHFWATWCPPCREELPDLLKLDGSVDMDVLAVSLDSSWDDVRGFFKEGLPPRIVLGSSTAADAFGVEQLPETYLMDAAGKIRLRFEGPRDWRSRALVRMLHDESRVD